MKASQIGTAGGTGKWNHEKIARWTADFSSHSGTFHRPQSVGTGSERRAMFSSSSSSASSSSSSTSSRSSRTSQRSSGRKKSRSCVRATGLGQDSFDKLHSFDFYEGSYGSLPDCLSLDFPPEKPSLHSATTSDYSTDDSEPPSPMATASTSRRCASFQDVRYESVRSYWESDSEIEDVNPSRKPRHRKFVTNLWTSKSEANSEPILISLQVLRNPGPLRLMVEKSDSVRHVMDLALRTYAYQGRHPSLGTNSQPFHLCCLTPEIEALDDKAAIGESGSRNFRMYTKRIHPSELEQVASASVGISSSVRTSWIWNQTWNRIMDAQNYVAQSMSFFTCKFFTWMASFKPWTFDEIFYVVLKALR